MSKQPKLTPTMIATLKQIALWGGITHRWPGGFWIDKVWYPGMTDPDWSKTTYLHANTLTALAKRGLLDAIRGEARLGQGFIMQFRLKLGSEFVLELLIKEYETAIWANPHDDEKVNSLCVQVEAEADRIGFKNHKLLAQLHTQAEQSSIMAEGGKADWEL